MTRMPPKSLLFLAESNLVEAANTSSSASRRTRRARVMSGVCDYCSSAEALVCCRADSARLCLSCDAWVRPCPLGKRRPARFSAALRWVRHSARGDWRARGLRARAGRERAAVASSRRFSLVMPRSAPGDDAQSRARRVFRPARHVVNRRRGAHLFPDRMALTADPSAPRRRCTARIRWRDDTSAPGYAIIVGARPEWCVPVLPSPPSRARSFTSRPARALGVNKTYRPERRREHLPDASPSTPERLPPTPAIVPVLNHPSDVSSAPQVACTVNRAVLCAGCDELTRHTAGGQPRVPLLSFSLADDAAVDANYHLSRHPFREGLYLCPPCAAGDDAAPTDPSGAEAPRAAPSRPSLPPAQQWDGSAAAPPPPPPSSRSILPLLHHQVGQVAQPLPVDLSAPWGNRDSWNDLSRHPSGEGQVSRRWQSAARWRASRG